MIMKKYFFSICLLLLAAACVEPLDKNFVPAVEDSEEGPKVTLSFTLPPATKGTMTHNPTIETIHVAVFNQNGVLRQYEQATLTHPENLTNGSTSADPVYTVDVNMSSKPRILHFIADSPVSTYEQLVALAGTSGEDVILNALTTDNGNTAYWQRFELDSISAYRYDGESYDGTGYPDGIAYSGTSYSYEDPNFGTITINKGDYIKRNGRKIIDGTGYFQSVYVAQVLRSIPFVRNFAEITVSKKEADGNFTPKKFALVNVPTAGYVAPFNTDSSTFSYVYSAKNPSLEGITHADVANAKYPGSLAGGFDTAQPASFIDVTGSSTNKYAYMYERTVPNSQQPATCILVGGTYSIENPAHDANGLTWFKIEIADASGAYFPIYRGVTYDFKIGQITGTRGYDSPTAAFAHDAIGDVSGSVETATLEQISDGNGTTLWVEYIDYVGTVQEDKTIYYTMYYQNGSSTEYLTGGIALSVSHPNNDEAYKAITASSISGSPYSGTGTPDDSKQWYVATVPLAAPGQNARQSVLHIEGNSHAGRAMYRNVNYHVIGTQYFKNGQNEVNATSLATEAAGEETTLTIFLPNDLGYSMFPLDLRIEAESGDFTTVDGLPVESGPSLFNPDKNAYYFIKTIEYSDYHNALTGATTTRFTTQFKTTRDGSTSVNHTNATNFRVLDKVQTERGRTNPYFAVAECPVTVGGPVFMLDKESVEVGVDETSATFSITSSGAENPTWTLTASDENVTLSQPSGSGNAEITVNFPANAGSEARTYMVTASREGFDDLTFTIVQLPPLFSVSPVSRTVNANDESTTFTLSSTGSVAPNWTLIAPTSITLSQSGGSGNAEITVTFPKNTSITDPVTYTVRAVRSGFENQTFTIVQLPKQKVEGRTVEYTYADFGTLFTNYAHKGGTGIGITREATKGNINVSISNIIAIVEGYSEDYGGVVEVQKREYTQPGYPSESVVTFSPVNTETVSNVTITDVQISFLRWNGTNYNPETITGPFTGGTGTSSTTEALTASYNGSASASAVSATFMPYASVGYDIVYISVTYDYYE